jgi:glycosyltransferase involved in cell wall biosynthesis
MSQLKYDKIDLMSIRIEGGCRLKGRMIETTPLISIITVVFRAHHDLSLLLQSIVRLKNEQIELIVVDGGSTDGTVDLLRQYDSKIDYWISEADRGIYDAMNKGIAAARGTFLLHLNAGDSLLHVPLGELETARAQNIDIAAFRVLIDGKYEFRPSSGIALMFNNTLHHQGTFYRREIFPEYDIRYKIFGDFDVNQRMLLNNMRIAIFNRVVALHLSGGISAVPTDAAVSEFLEIIAKNYGRKCLHIAWLLGKWRGFKSRLGQISVRDLP